MSGKGYCEVSQQIRERLHEGRIVVGSLDSSVESRIQPCSFEPVIGDHGFILDADMGGIFRPNERSTVRRSLLRVPASRRQRVSFERGFELKRGFSYLIPLQEQIILNPGELVISSPKSSRGRLFLDSRLLADYNSSFDEASLSCNPSLLNLWLLVQPAQFNVIVREGLTLNQLRFFNLGLDSRVSDSELRDIAENSPLCHYHHDGFDEPLQQVIRDGLQLHLDLKGKNTSGVVGLRARNNPHPIDLSERSLYDASEYFEPMVAKDGTVVLGKGDRCLFASREVLHIPPSLSAQLDDHSHVGLRGTLHLAGFFDPDFYGDGVYEVISEEQGSVKLEDGMPLSRLVFFRTNQIPDKLYGEKIGSSYHRQIGPRVSNNFRAFDFKRAARDYDKLDRDVLVQEATTLLEHRHEGEGFEFCEERFEALNASIASGFFHSRYDCETDTQVLQPIPYIVLFGPDKTVFSYVRASSIEDYGDERLFGKHSVGVGGHIIRADAPDYLANCVARELAQEVCIDGTVSRPKFVGTLMTQHSPVDRVHFGLVYALHADGNIGIKESSAISGRMLPISSFKIGEETNSQYETWSRILIPHLPQIHDF